MPACRQRRSAILFVIMVDDPLDEPGRSSLDLGLEPPDDALVERVVGLVRTVPGVPGDVQIDADTRFGDEGLGLDSLASFELLLSVEKALEVELDPDALAEAGALDSPRALAAFVARVRAEREAR